MVEVARSTSITIAVGADTVSAGVKATWTRTGPIVVSEALYPALATTMIVWPSRRRPRQMVCYRHPRVETAVSCSNCGRPICTDCMVFGPVGIRCPEMRRRADRARRRAARVQTAAAAGPRPARHDRPDHAQRRRVPRSRSSESGIQSIGGTLYEKGALFGPLVADGEWWRLITTAFLHAGLLHLVFNMLALWWFGRILEGSLGHWRFLGLYIASALAGSAGALLLSPDTPTVGASGAVFGIFGAGLVLERQHIRIFGGAALPIVVLNLVFTSPSETSRSAATSAA